MDDLEYEVGLFRLTDDGVALVGRSRHPEIVEVVLTKIAAERRRELADLEPPIRLVPPQDDDEGAIE